jgi:uncharacterized tellurite resistance protein B-like protein
MILANSDDTVDDNELDVIKNHFYEDCLSEAEWREIDFYRLYKPNKTELENILNDVTKQMQSSKDRKDLLEALKEIVIADDVLKEQEKEILDFLTQNINSNSLPYFNHIFKKIKSSIFTKNSFSEDKLAVEFTKNPIAPLLKTHVDEGKIKNIDLVAAKLGLALIVIYSDMSFDKEEKNAFEELVKKECMIDEKKFIDLVNKIYLIPENYFEMTYLCRFITDSSTESERYNILKDLFKMAYANNQYDAYEDKYLKLIARSLFISDQNFIKIKRNEI